MSETGARLTETDHEERTGVLGWWGDKGNSGGILTVKDQKRDMRQKASEGVA